jgi:hypothetical protein
MSADYSNSKWNQELRRARLSRPFKPTLFFPSIPVPSPKPAGSVYYRCDACKTVTRYVKPPERGPEPCLCGASSIDQFPVKPWQVDDFELPPDAAPGVLDPNRIECYTCEPCPYFECWHRNPGKTCGLGVPQHTYWDAAENRVIHPAFSGCWDHVQGRENGSVIPDQNTPGLDVGVISNYPHFVQWVALVPFLEGDEGSGFDTGSGSVQGDAPLCAMGGTLPDSAG